MKKIVLTAAAVFATAALAYGFNQNTIVGSAHDLTTTNSGAYVTGAPAGLQGSDNQICVYCHTPHNAGRNIPLWNRQDPSPQALYNSVTLTDTAKAASMVNNSVSAFCMSCHDGVTKLGAIKNVPTPTAAASDRQADTILTSAQAFGTAITQAYAALGTTGNGLTNDHPIGFSYSAAASEDAASGTGGLNDITTVKTKFGISASGAYQPFFDATTDSGTVLKDRMECASCHKVHMPGKSGNFLRIENGGSNLCLACHAK